MPLPLLGALAGVLSTLGMDLGSLLAMKAGAPRPPHLPYIGRWFLYVLRGQFAHHTIVEAPGLSGEGVAGVIGHYFIGAALGIAFVVVGSAMPQRTWTLGLSFGVLTCALPWLLMFPSMGFGAFGLHGPGGSRLVMLPIPGHLVFGMGLALWVTLLRRIGD